MVVKLFKEHSHLRGRISLVQYKSHIKHDNIPKLASISANKVWEEGGGGVLNAEAEAESICLEGCYLPG